MVVKISADLTVFHEVLQTVCHISSAVYAFSKEVVARGTVEVLIYVNLCDRTPHSDLAVLERINKNGIYKAH